MDKCLQRAKYNKINIPYRILRHAVETNSFRSVQILVTCKLLFGGVFNESDTNSIAAILGIHPKTIKQHLDKLKTRHMIGYDHVSGLYFNRGWNYLRILLDDELTVGYRIRLDQIKKFKAFAIAGTYDQLIASQQSRRWRAMRESLKKGSSRQIAYGTNGYYPVANAAYAKIFRVSEATASRYRSLACNEGFLEVKPSYMKVMVEVNPGVDGHEVKEHLGTGLVYRKGGYYLQEPTMVRSKMKRKRMPSLMRKKLQALENGIVKGKK